MKIKQTMRTLLVAGIFVLPLVSIFIPVASVGATCGGVPTAIITCTEGDGTGSGGVQDTGIWGILMIVINILLGGVAVLALAGIVYGAVLYTSAGGNPEQVKKAMGVFTNVVIGIVAFAGMWVLLNFLVPGGVFEGII